MAYAEIPPNEKVSYNNNIETWAYIKGINENYVGKLIVSWFKEYNIYLSWMTIAISKNKRTMMNDEILQVFFYFV